MDLPLVLTAKNLERAGFVHGFSTRESVELGRFAQAAGLDLDGLRQVVQVHGAGVVDARDLPDGFAPRVEGDAIVLGPVGPALSGGPPLSSRALTPQPPLPERERGSRSVSAVGVRVADCVPVLVATRDEGEVAAIHAGWRGVEAGVVMAAVSRLRGRERVAAIGPCICAECFEVGADVASRIASACAGARVVVKSVGEKAYVDLRAAVRAQLSTLGVTDVEDVPGCTKHEPARFFSYRRDAGNGRHYAAIALR